VAARDSRDDRPGHITKALARSELATGFMKGASLWYID